MIASLAHLVVRIFLLAVRAIGIVSQITSLTSLRVILVLCIIVYSLSRYFRLKQPQLPQNLVDAIAGTRSPFDAANGLQYTAAPTKPVWPPLGCGPIANRAGCLDSIENSRSAIKNVGIRLECATTPQINTTQIILAQILCRTLFVHARVETNGAKSSATELGQ